MVKALADSFAFCDDAFAALTDQSVAEMVTGGRGGPRAKAVMLSAVVEHGNEMYGIGTVYQRLKGVVPPSTEAQQQRRADRAAAAGTNEASKAKGQAGGRRLGAGDRSRHE